MQHGGNFLNFQYLSHFCVEIIVQKIVDEYTQFVGAAYLFGTFFGFTLIPNAKILAFRTKWVDDPNAQDDKKSYGLFYGHFSYISYAVSCKFTSAT